MSKLHAVSELHEPVQNVLLRLNNITVTLDGRDVLERVSLAVSAGEIVTVVGPNGAGKSTLIRASIGLLTPTSGSVSRGVNVRVGYVPQHVSVSTGLPLDVTRFLGLVKGAHASAIERVLAESRAQGLRKRQMHSLSAGEMRRVLFARALLVDPELLVLDEPTAGVDVHGQSELFDLISGIRERRGCGVLLVSHDLLLVMAATDRVVCLNHHICCQGQPADVSRHPEYRQLFGSSAASVAIYEHDHGHHHDHFRDICADQPVDVSDAGA